MSWPKLSFNYCRSETQTEGIAALWDIKAKIKVYERTMQWLLKFCLEVIHILSIPVLLYEENHIARPEVNE